jgi:hypothetical protein
VAAYIFPAGGQRGHEVKVRIGGLFLHDHCTFEMLGNGVQFDPTLRRVPTTWFEGPLIPLPDSQQAEDYPKDLAGQVRIDANAPTGPRYWRLATSQGATPAMKFVVGELPEVVEDEIDGDPVPVGVAFPVTINGRIFPREDVDIWTFAAKKGEVITCEVNSARLGFPLDARLEVLDQEGKRLGENDDRHGADPLVCFVAPRDGTYRARIHDVQFRGGQAFVYRLTITAGPHVEAVYPLGGKRAAQLRVEPLGLGLSAEPLDIALPANAASLVPVRLNTTAGLTNPVFLELDDLPELREAEPNDRTIEARPTEVPCVCNGRIDRPGDVDFWEFPARKGVPLVLELRASRLGSLVRGVVAVEDLNGKELVRAESDGASDPSLTFTAPADASYRVRVADRFRTRGGPQFAYRLRITPPPPPDFSLRLAADALTLPRGSQAKLRVTAERRGGHSEPISIEVRGLPAGVSAASLTIPGNQSAGEIQVKAESNAPIASGRITIRGSAKIGQAVVTRIADLSAPPGEPLLDSVLVAVALPTPFKIVGDYEMRWAARGSIQHRRYRIERNGYDGPIEVSLADRQARHLQGVTGRTITVPARATEFEYSVSLPPWMEMGRTSRVCVMGVASLKEPDGATHQVSFSSVAQNEQIVAVIEPGRFSLEASPVSLLLKPGAARSIAVQVARGKGLNGPVTVQLVAPCHMRGLAATSVVIPAEASQANLIITMSAEASGPWNMPVTLQATILENHLPIVAEAKLSVVADSNKSNSVK